MGLNIPKYMKQSIFLLTICAGILIVFVLVFIMPSKKEMAKLDFEIGAAKFKVETQEKLDPLYRGLQEKLKKIDNKASLPPTQPIAKSQLGNFSGTVSGMAQKSKLVLLSVYPETSSSIEPGVAVYNASLRGNFVDFRNFLKEIGSLPYLDKIEDIQVNTGSGVRQFNVKMKLLVA
jgi:hypothetical protein